MKTKFYILMFLVAIFAFGCATQRMYDGPKLLKEQVASIKVSRSHWLYFPPTFFGVSGIDVLSTEDKGINPLVCRLVTRIEVLPVFQSICSGSERSVGGEQLDGIHAALRDSSEFIFIIQHGGWS